MPAERSASSRISSRSHGAASLGLAVSDTCSVSPIRAEATQGTSRRRSLPLRVPARKPRLAVRITAHGKGLRGPVTPHARPHERTANGSCFCPNEVADRPRPRQRSAPMGCDVAIVASRPGPWRGSGILSPPAPRGLAIGPGQLPKRRGTGTIASLARPAHAPAMFFWRSCSRWPSCYGVQFLCCRAVAMCDPGVMRGSYLVPGLPVAQFS